MDINRTIFNFNFFDIYKKQIALREDGDCAKRRFQAYKCDYLEKY